MAKITELVRALAQPIAAENGCSIWDVEYVREAGTWFLRVYLDKEGGVTIDDCEAVSRPLSDALDEVEVRLYRAVEGRKDHVGLLRGYENGDVTVDLPTGAVTFPKKDVAQVRLYVRV